MTIDITTPRSRRRLLSAAAGAIGALAAEAVIPRAAVEAANGDPFILGSATNAATSTTRLSSGDDSPVLEVATIGSESFAGTAISGTALNGDGEGVTGITTTGRGVVGVAHGAGIAVKGDATAQVGTGTGIGVQAMSTYGIALQVDGKVRFSRSGRTWIRTGHSSLTLNVRGTTGSSRVFAILSSNRPGRYVRAVVPTTDAFTVYLNASATSDSVVTWFILD